MNMNGLSTPSNLAELGRSISIQVSGSSQFSKFQNLYRNDRIAFAYDILGKAGKSLTGYQEEILGYFDDGYYRVAVRGPHGLGKTYLAAVLVHHGVLTSEEDAKIPTTASAWRQLEKYLWPEIHKLATFIQWDKIGRAPYDTNTEIFNLSIKIRGNGNPIESYAVASDDHNTIEGAHGRMLMYIFDEAKAIPRNTWNAAEGAFSNARTSSTLDDGIEAISKSELLENGIEAGRQAWLGNTRYIRIPRQLPVETRRPVTDSSLAAWIKSGEIIEDRSIVKEPALPASNIVSRAMEAIRNRDIQVMSVSMNFDQEKDVRNTGDIPSVENIDILEGRKNSEEMRANSEALGSTEPRNTGVESTHSREHSILEGSIIDSRIVVDSVRIDSNKTLPPPAAYHTINTSTTNNLHQSQEDTNTLQSAPDRAYAFAISTPGDPSGQFYDIHSHKPGYEDWHTRHVTIEEAIRAGRISADWVRQRERQWGRDSSIFQNRVLGEFANDSEEGIIPLSWVRASVERWKDWKRMGSQEPHGRKVIGVDPARYGSDKTVAAKRTALVLTNIYYFSKLSTTSLTGYLLGMLHGYHLNIEMDGGLAAGVVDMLREKEVPNIHPITVAAKTPFVDRSGELKFLNVRAAMWWNMREILDPKNGMDCCLPPVEGLILDLSTPKYINTSSDLIQLEAKPDIMARLGRSPDYGSACCLAFWTYTGGGGGVVI